MKIFLNGEPFEVAETQLLSDLLQELQLSQQSLAVAINAQVIPRSQYNETRLQAADKIELVRAVGGG